MKKHELKILPQYLQAVWNGTKTFELRKDDRDYQRGDILVLREWDGEKYTGSGLCVKVTYILQDADKYGLKDGYVIMGIRRIESSADFKPQTNYDLLISKTPEELAKYLSQAWYDGPVFECPARASVGVDRCAEVKDCEDCFLDWLKAPVEEGDG